MDPLRLSFPIVGDTNQLSIIFFCLTVSLIKLFRVKLLKIAQTIRLIISPLNYSLIFCYNTSVTFSTNNNLSNSAGSHKIKWGKISKNEIESCYTVPIDFEMSTLSMSDYNSLLDSLELIITFLMKLSAPFVKITKPRSKTGRKN